MTDFPARAEHVQSCAECGYPLTSGLAHPTCCDHEHVESEDQGGGDGWDAPVHDWVHTCLDCGAGVYPDGPWPEGGWGGWFVL